MASKINGGFTLIEVLVSMVVLSLGLLGLAGLQAAALKNNQSSYYRSQATQFAYDLADRIRANKVEASKGSTSKYITLKPDKATEKTDCETLTGCSTVFMAENDLFQWNREVSAQLPSGSGLININGNVFTITISWDDNKDGGIDDDDPNFQMSFQL